jgi:hypothetical protein
MPTSFDYRQLARECMKEAEATKDAACKKTLEDIAKLYTQTAFSMDDLAQDNRQQDNRQQDHRQAAVRQAR